MSTIRQSSTYAILAVAAFSSMIGVSYGAQAALQAPRSVAVEQQSMPLAVMDKTSNNKLELMLLIHRAGLPVGGAVPGVAR